MQLKSWKLEPPTNRQLKVLTFFSVDYDKSLTRGRAAGILYRVFQDEVMREHWLKYLFLTGDETQDSPDLMPYRYDELASTVLPTDWKPRRARPKSGTKASSLDASDHRQHAMEFAIEVLKEGIPFEEIEAEARFDGRRVCCTGVFAFGSRKACLDAIKNAGGIAQDDVTGTTDFLVVGTNVSPSWAEEQYGRKIEKALQIRFKGGHIRIISETDWARAIGESNGVVPH